ncbi:MAG TPA: hypothetical protein VFB54_03645 [Burkholderiales bacterium]|nr:hypothetical protein [Burkholderiales bacterium]
MRSRAVVRLLTNLEQAELRCSELTLQLARAEQRAMAAEHDAAFWRRFAMRGTVPLSPVPTWLRDMVRA